MQIAAELIGEGLDHRAITNRIYDTVKKQKLQFLGEIYGRIEYFAGGKISYLYCSDSLMDKYGISFDDIEELPNTILSVEGVKVSVLLKDREGGYKVSTRGKDIIDLSAIAATFGGGGHVNAAGLSIDGEKDEVIKSLIEKIETALEIAENDR